jgi:hypothetical protein
MDVGFFLAIFSTFFVILSAAMDLLFSGARRV